MSNRLPYWIFFTVVGALFIILYYAFPSLAENRHYKFIASGVVLLAVGIINLFSYFRNREGE